MLEGLEGRALRVDERQAAVEAAVPGDEFVLGGLGVGLSEPELGDLVLAADQLVHVLGGGIVFFQQLVAVVSIDVLLR